MKLLKDSQGLALFMVIFVMAFFLLFVTGGLIFSQLELKKASNFKLAVQALETADAGLQHGLAAIYSGWNFNTNLVTDTCTTPPCPIRYTDANTGSPVSISNLPFASTGFSYTVTAKNDNPADTGGATSDTNNTIILNSTAYGPDNTTPLKQVQAYVGRSTGSWTPPGAFFFPGTTANTDDPNWMHFSGINFRISGIDTNPIGTAGPKPALPAIATNDSGKTSQIIGKIGSQYSQVTGLGSNPSVVIVPISNTTVDFDQLITKILNLGGAAVVNRSVGTYDGSGAVTFGTSAAPKITHVTGNGALNLIGSFTGYGILIFESDQSNCCYHLAIGENAQFQGLIISRTHVHLDPIADGLTTKANGSALSASNARIWGSVMMQQHIHSSFGIEGSSRLYYSSLALQNYVLTPWGSALPKTAVVRSWVDKMN